MLELFSREWVCDLSRPGVVLFDYGLCQEGVELRDCIWVLSSVHYCLLKCEDTVVVFIRFLVRHL